MKVFIATLLFSFLLCSCSRSTPPGPEEPDRPGEPPAEPGKIAVSFAPGNASEVSVGSTDDEIHIILYRDARLSTPGQSCALSLTDGGDFARVSPTADFADGASTAEAILGFSPAKMGAERRFATIKIAGTEESLTILFKKVAEQWQEAGRWLMFTGTGFAEMEASKRTAGKTTEWKISGKDFERRFSTDGLSVAVVPAGGVVSGQTYGKTGQWAAAGVESYCGNDMIALNVCTLKDGKAEFPHSEYYFPVGKDYACASICDGWLLPVVAIDAKLLDPKENIWTAPALPDGDGGVTVFGPYHHGSPLHGLNAAGLDASWHISIKDGAARLAEQFSAFRNKDIIPFDFMIYGEGLTDSKGSVLTFDAPMHNYAADGNRSAHADRTWAKIMPTTITISAIEH